MIRNAAFTIPKYAVMIDIDGTISDMRHRLWMIRGDNNMGEEFLQAAVDDNPYDYMLYLLRILFTHPNQELRPTIFLCTAREEYLRGITEQWLRDNAVYYDKLLMRDDVLRGVPDHLVKLSMYSDIVNLGYTVMFAIEDRPSNVEALRDAGVNCLQADDREWKTAQNAFN